jgi:predicted  nucleic acid-binding Zn-ribbon protein
MAEVSLEMLQSLVQRGLDEQAALRREVGEVRSLALALADQGRRLERRFGDMERRISDIRDDLELMLRAELMGRLGHFETQIEARLDGLEARLGPQ